MRRNRFVLAPVVLLAACGRSPAPPSQPTEPVTRSQEAAPAPQQARGPSPFGDVPSQPGPTVIPAGTALRVRMDGTIDTARNRAGDRFGGRLVEPVTIGDRVVLPKGARVEGHVTAAARSGRLRGRAQLSLTLDSIESGGRAYAVDTAGVARASTAHKRRNAALIGGGGALGAALGAVAGGARGALIGLGAGAGAGTAGAALTGRRDVKLPAESVLTFSLRRPMEL